MLSLQHRKRCEQDSRWSVQRTRSLESCGSHFAKIELNNTTCACLVLALLVYEVKRTEWSIWLADDHIPEPYVVFLARDTAADTY